MGTGRASVGELLAEPATWLDVSLTKGTVFRPEGVHLGPSAAKATVSTGYLLPPAPSIMTDVADIFWENIQSLIRGFFSCPLADVIGGKLR